MRYARRRRRVALAAPSATVMPYGYAGGPVVAEAMKPLYAEDSFNYPDGYTLALLAATVAVDVALAVPYEAVMDNEIVLQSVQHIRN